MANLIKIIQKEKDLHSILVPVGNEIKKFNLRKFLKETGYFEIIRLRVEDYKVIDFSKGFFTQFNLQTCGNVPGEVYLLPKIIRTGYLRANGEEVLPVTDFQNCLICECLEVRENLSYDDLTELDFEFALKNINNSHELKKVMVERYSQSLPDLSKEEIINKGISFTKLKILGIFDSKNYFK